jgi:hypothetical protein
VAARYAREELAYRPVSGRYPAGLIDTLAS